MPPFFLLHQGRSVKQASLQEFRHTQPGLKHQLAKPQKEQHTYCFEQQHTHQMGHTQLARLLLQQMSNMFHITMPMTGTFLIVAFLTVGVAAPTPGAVGGFHVAYRAGASGFFGASNEAAVGAAIILHAISFVPVALLGLLFMVQDGVSLGRLSDLRDAAPAPGASATATTPERSAGA